MSAQFAEYFIAIYFDSFFILQFGHRYNRPGLDVEVCHMTAARSTYSCHEAAVVLDCLQHAKLGGSIK